MLLSAQMRDAVGEKVDILSISRKGGTPGRSLPESTVVSQVSCILKKQGEEAEVVPVTTTDTVFRAILLKSEIPDDKEPKVSQIVKRGTGERLTIVSKPLKRRGYIMFDCQHSR